MDAGDARLQKARDEIALLALMGMLLVPVGLSLFLADSPLDPKAMAVMIVGLGFFLPVLVLKGVLRDRSRAGIAFVPVAAAGAAYVATWHPMITVVAVLCGGAGALLFYRIKSNTSYRPRLRGE